MNLTFLEPGVVAAESGAHTCLRVKVGAARLPETESEKGTSIEELRQEWRWMQCGGGRVLFEDRVKRPGDVILDRWIGCGISDFTSHAPYSLISTTLECESRVRLAISLD